jgi:hypothetical protein
LLTSSSACRKKGRSGRRLFQAGKTLAVFKEIQCAFYDQFHADVQGVLVDVESRVMVRVNGLFFRITGPDKTECTGCSAGKLGKIFTG